MKRNRNTIQSRKKPDHSDLHGNVDRWKANIGNRHTSRPLAETNPHVSDDQPAHQVMTKVTGILLLLPSPWAGWLACCLFSSALADAILSPLLSIPLRRDGWPQIPPHLSQHWSTILAAHTKSSPSHTHLGTTQPPRKALAPTPDPPVTRPLL